MWQVIIQFMIKKWYIFVIVLLLILLLTFGYCAISTCLYKPESTVFIDSSRKLDYDKFNYPELLKIFNDDVVVISDTSNDELIKMFRKNKIDLGRKNEK